MNEIYNRLLQFLDYKGFKSLNEFALKGLGYASMEKLSRLKKENTSPSFDILYDLSNKFEDLDLNWFVTGRGNMVFDVKVEIDKPHFKTAEPETIYVSDKELLGTKDKLIQVLENDLVEARRDKDFFRTLIESKLLTTNK